MIDRVSILYVLAAIICVGYFSNCAPPPSCSTGATTKCEELDKPTWTINCLASVTLDAWPWNCLNSRYTNTSLHDVVSKSCADISEAARKGYIGFVQYYAEKEGADLNAGTKPPLYLAIENEHSNVVKYISSRLDANYLVKRQYKLDAPLLFAADLGQMETVKFFLDDRKADSVLRNYHKKYLLRKVARSGNLDLMKYLVDGKGYPVITEDVTLLLSAGLGGNADMLKYLIFEKNLRKNGTISYNDNTVLHEAAQAGKLEVVRFFVETLHYPVDVRNFLDETPAHFAVAGGNLAVIKYLIEEKGADLNALYIPKEGMLHKAVEGGQLAVFKYLVDEKHMDIEVKDMNGKTILQRAIEAGELDVVQYLAGEKKANVKTRDKLGNTVLHDAVRSGQIELLKYLLDDMKLTSLIDETDEKNRTPAMIAACWGTLEMLKYLVDERHANTTVTNVDGEDMLHTAVKCHLFPAVKYLVEERKFDIKAESISGITAFDLAKEEGAPRGKPNLILEYFQKRIDAPKS